MHVRSALETLALLAVVVGCANEAADSRDVEFTGGGKADEWAGNLAAMDRLVAASLPDRSHPEAAVLDYLTAEDGSHLVWLRAGESIDSRHANIRTRIMGWADLPTDTDAPASLIQPAEQVIQGDGVPRFFDDLLLLTEVSEGSVLAVASASRGPDWSDSRARLHLLHLSRHQADTWDLTRGDNSGPLAGSRLGFVGVDHATAGSFAFCAYTSRSGTGLVNSCYHLQFDEERREATVSEMARPEEVPAAFALDAG